MRVPLAVVLAKHGREAVVEANLSSTMEATCNFFYEL